MFRLLAGNMPLAIFFTKETQRTTGAATPNMVNEQARGVIKLALSRSDLNSRHGL
jgi:hypothetical protein